MKFKTTVFAISIVILFLYPLLFGYTSWFLLDFQLYFLFCICTLIALYFISFKTRGVEKYLRLFLSIVLLGLFFFTKGFLVEKAEVVYFWIHKGEFEKIQEMKISDFAIEDRDKYDTATFFHGGYRVCKVDRFTAIGVKGILDNTDGFFYWSSGELPRGFFGGNLTYYKHIGDNWFIFSTR